MFSLSFAALPDEWDLQVLENYYIDSNMLTTVQRRTQKIVKLDAGKVFCSYNFSKYWIEFSALMKNWQINRQTSLFSSSAAVTKHDRPVKL